MTPIDLKEHFGDIYQIAHDEAAIGPAQKSDPRLYIIPGTYGHVYPHSDTILAVYCDRPRLFRRLAELEGTTRHQIGDTEAVYLFGLSSFDAVAAIVQPKRKRRLSVKHTRALQAGGRDHRFRGHLHGTKGHLSEL